MARYKFSKEELSFIEDSCIPYAVYQFVDKKVVTLGLSRGFMDLFGFDDKEKAYHTMDNDMYCDTHEADKVYLEEAAVSFALGKTKYDVSYRSKIKGKYHTIRAIGHHKYVDGIQLAYVWYIDEGEIDGYQKKDVVSYSSIANALSSDYMYLYYVNLDDDSFVEYSFNSSKNSLTAERRGTNFFARSRKDALELLYPYDIEDFLNVFYKDKILEAIDNEGSFNHSYRLLIDGNPVFVNMKAVRMLYDSNNMIIGVNNVDSQMRQREEIERINDERTIYLRMKALSGDFIAIYTVDPVTGNYSEFSASSYYEDLDLDKKGENFFEKARHDSASALYKDDIDRFNKVFTKENVLKTIDSNGIFMVNYRLITNGEVHNVSLKAAKVVEKDGEKIIIGVVNIDNQVKQEQEYAYNLRIAKERADMDALTGLKNKHAYVDVVAEIDEKIDNKEPVEFGIVVCDVNDLKHINDTKGHTAGDDYLKKAASVICNVFQKSPVFRVGGDEFAVIVQGHDYKYIYRLLGKLRDLNEHSLETGGIVIACGMAKYKNDRRVAAVFERADISMYENKKELKL